MRLLLFLLIFLFADALNNPSTDATSATSTDTSTIVLPSQQPPSPLKKMFNNIMTDYLICARQRHRDGSFMFEKCARYAKTGFHPFCVYMVIPSTETTRGTDFYGCAYAHNIPEECTEKGEYYSSLESVKIRGKVYNGSMMCCMDNYCNQLEEPVFSMVRIKDTDMDDIYLPMFTLIAVLIVFLFFYPFINNVMVKRSDACNERTERPWFLEDSIGIERTMETRRLPFQQSMKFPSLRKMQEIVRKILQPKKYSTSTTHQEQAPQEKVNDFKDLQRKDEVHAFQRDDENPRKLDRQIPTRYDHLAQRMIEHGPFYFDFDPVELGDLFDSVAQILAYEPTLLELQPEVDVYGNLDGSYGDLFRWMHHNGWPPRKKVLFLGGLSHEDEPYSLETITLIFAMKKLMPNHVYIIRGASEVYPLKLQEKRFSSNINAYLTDVIQRACGYLPLAATVQGVFFSHGGLSPRIDSLKKISDLKRPIHYIANGSIAADLIFSQASFTDGVIPGSRGWQFSNKFEPDLTLLLPDKTNQNVQLFVRARNCSTDGFLYINRNILSIWSAPGYPVDNRGGCSLSFSYDMEMTIYKMGVYGTYERAEIAKMEENQKKLRMIERKNRKQKKSKDHMKRKGDTMSPRSTVTTKSTESPFKTLGSNENAKK